MPDQFWSASDRCQSKIPGYVIDLRTPATSLRARHTAEIALEGAPVCGTGHCRLSLLCGALALDVSAPSARKYGFPSNWSQTRVEMHKHARSALGSAGCGSSARAWRTAGLPSAVAWRGRSQGRGGARRGRAAAACLGRPREASVNHVKRSGCSTRPKLKFLKSPIFGSGKPY